MNIEKMSSLILISIITLSGLQAQEATTTAGGEASGSGGSSSYTVGQVVYTTQTGTNGNSVVQGVQQPFEISVVTGMPEAEGINLSVSAYPNPTTDYLTVKVDAPTTLSIQSMKYQVFDIHGKLLQTVKATGQETQIETTNLIPANYFVKVLNNNKEIKVFKFIKTN